MNDSEKVRTLVVEAVATAADYIDKENVAERWEEPSALEGMTIGALAAHLVRAAGSTLAYLDRTSPDTTTDGDLLNPVTYFHAAVDSPIHEQIKTVSSEEAANGHAAIVAICRDTVSELASRLRKAGLSGPLEGAFLPSMISVGLDSLRCCYTWTTSQRAWGNNARRWTPKRLPS